MAKNWKWEEALAAEEERERKRRTMNRKTSRPRASRDIRRLLALSVRGPSRSLWQRAKARLFGERPLVEKL